MNRIDVSSICNALVDILIAVSDQDLKDLGLEKGIMHLTEVEQHGQILHRFANHEKTVELGGSCLNAIRTLAAMGLKTGFSGTIGQDKFGGCIKERLAELQIEGNLQELTADTGSSVILVTEDGERTMNTHLGASRLFDESLVVETQIKQSSIFHFCGYQWDTPGQIHAIEKALAVAKENQTLVSFDVADPFVVERYRTQFVDLICSKADIVFANQEEAKLLYEGSPEHAAQQIAKSHSVAVIKLGSEGALVRRGDEEIIIPPVPTHVVDSTAAGDMFAAGFLYGQIAGLSYGDCGKIAATLASDTICRMGAVVSSQVIRELCMKFPTG